MGFKAERRFLDSSTPNIDHDNFSLEIFTDCSFFNHHHDSTSAVDRFLDDDDDRAGDITAEARRIYWESQHFLLQEILEQYHSIGSKLRQGITRQINKARETAGLVHRAAVVNQLCSKGFNAHLRVSRWSTTNAAPAGCHEYIEVRALAGKKSQTLIPIVVELGFKDEFRMAKACQGYNDLVKQLPEIFIGKWEHMKAIVRLLCEAARKSTHDRNIHLAPWRKNSFMQMKWSPSTSSMINSTHPQLFTST